MSGRPAGVLVRRGAISALVTAIALLLLGVATGPFASADRSGRRSDAAPPPCTTPVCYVAVSVSTLWVRPWYPRAIDEPALANPARPRAWLSALTVPRREWLVGKLETQALYGTKVLVIGRWHGWVHVTVPSQPTDRDARGYPGWVPAVQLTRQPPPVSSVSAVIRAPSAWLWNAWTSHGVAGSAVMLASFDTRLPVLRASGRHVEVGLIGGRRVALRRRDVVLHAGGSGWSATRAGILEAAREFLGLPYLWAGTSGLGYDCSGFTYAVYHAHGVTLSRDADQQAAHGGSVPRSSLQPGDLVFFRNTATGPISHVGLYIGAGEMIDAPHTGAQIRIDALTSFPHYAGARRYLSH